MLLVVFQQLSHELQIFSITFWSILDEKAFHRLFEVILTAECTCGLFVFFFFLNLSLGMILKYFFQLLSVLHSSSTEILLQLLTPKSIFVALSLCCVLMPTLAHYGQLLLRGSKFLCQYSPHHTYLKFTCFCIFLGAYQEYWIFITIA